MDQEAEIIRRVLKSVDLHIKRAQKAIEHYRTNTDNPNDIVCTKDLNAYMIDLNGARLETARAIREDILYHYTEDYVEIEIERSRDV
jgi:hypothetical protein